MSTETLPKSSKSSETLLSATVRLCGDSGDGMQLLGGQLTNTSAVAGNDVATFPDYPAEIRAPRGTQAGVSGFQVQFASEEIFTPGDTLNALVAMNPAALITNLADLEKGGILIVNNESFEEKDLKLAKLNHNPLEGDELNDYRLFKVPMTTLTRKAVEEYGLSTKDADKCRNFFAMGLVYWLYGRELDATLRFLDEKFVRKGKPEVAGANERALRAGWYYGETTEAFVSHYHVDKAQLPPGTYRNVNGNQALAWGLITAAKLSNKELFLGSYPITPASDILHELSRHKNFGVRTFQAEDEIAAICSTIGAAFGGAMAITTSSGPGIALKGEAMGLGVMLELPMIIINVQRGGPSTGLPTKTEQADLFQALFGRNGECPMPVIATQGPADCFDAAQDAWRIAASYMTPVMLLSDGYIANGSEPWRIPDAASLPKIPIKHYDTPPSEEHPFLPYKRDERLSRPWALPGTKGLMHRVGGLEKQNETGNVSYDPDNHEFMVRLRQEKTDKVADSIPEAVVEGPENGDLLVLSWGGTFGACKTACARSRQAGLSVAHYHLRWLNPFPRNLESVLRRYKTVLVPELNMGQLRTVLRGKFLLDIKGYNKIKGKPFAVSELVAVIKDTIESA
ncbi:MAG: 2-oxoacid:acceptor oxidoreductase subunit alpha [Planctomycetales bacterium]|nr:2-oxoacid:acceptor oxidoreductase subunit alpha [Planctomycetales bacterium]